MSLLIPKERFRSKPALKIDHVNDYAHLEAENARLREALRECVEFMEADCREECEWPCPDSVACGRKKIFLKAREVLGDE